MRLKEIIKFQKTLALFVGASNAHEKKAAELAVRRLVKARNLDPTRVPDLSYVADLDFKENPLLKELREEWREAHPKAAVNTKARRKPKPVNMYEGIFDDFDGPVNTKEPKPMVTPTDSVNTKPGSDRNRDRHSPGYMRDYMRRRRTKPKAKPKAK